eukprot:1177390-Prorocentrum_minimum.AAC.1
MKVSHLREALAMVHAQHDAQRVPTVRQPCHLNHAVCEHRQWRRSRRLPPLTITIPPGRKLATLDLLLGGGGLLDFDPPLEPLLHAGLHPPCPLLHLAPQVPPRPVASEVDEH